MNKQIIGAIAISSSVLLSSNSFAADQADQMGQSNGSVQTIQQKAKGMMSEMEMKTAIMTELGTYNKDVTVMVKDNTVFLIGKLPSDTVYEDVVTKVESVKGIGDINVDELTVKDSEQPLKDTYITAKVKGSLIKYDLFDKDIPSWTVHIETKNGVVYLSGTVDTEKDKLAVLNVVKSIKDVKEVEDQMKIANMNNENGGS